MKHKRKNAQKNREQKSTVHSTGGADAMAMPWSGLSKGPFSDISSTSCAQQPQSVSGLKRRGGGQALGTRRGHFYRGGTQCHGQHHKGEAHTAQHPSSLIKKSKVEIHA